jgi:hypothetical protein
MGGQGMPHGAVAYGLREQSWWDADAEDLEEFKN